MTRWFAFLRGINVGKHVVKMEALRAAFEAMEFGDVSTFIASGNVIFSSEDSNPADFAGSIESALKTKFGFAMPVFLRTAAQLQCVVAECPFDIPSTAAAGHSIYVSMIADTPDSAARANIEALTSELDEFRVHDRAVYWLCRGRMSESPVFTKNLLDKALGVPATSRNMNTIVRLIAKYCAKP